MTAPTSVPLHGMGSGHVVDLTPHGRLAMQWAAGLPFVPSEALLRRAGDIVGQCRGGSVVTPALAALAHSTGRVQRTYIASVEEWRTPEIRGHIWRRLRTDLATDAMDAGEGLVGPIEAHAYAQSSDIGLAEVDIIGDPFRLPPNTVRIRLTLESPTRPLLDGQETA